MKLEELMEAIVAANPRALRGTTESKARLLIRAAFASVVSTIESTRDGMVVIAGLGRFRVRQVEREVEGKKIVREQIVFRPAKAKAKAKEKDVGAKEKRAGKSAG